MEILYPPRPISKIQSHQLSSYEKSGKWVVQRKFNGTRVVIHILPGGAVHLFNRHGEKTKQFDLTSGLKREILSLQVNPHFEYWLDGELLNNKTTSPNYKGKIVLFDVLQAGKYLFGAPNLMGRLELLNHICGNPKEKEPNLGLALRVTDSIWLAETFDSDFIGRYQDFIDKDEIEGVVVKKKDSVLDNFGKKEYEIAWQIRCRKPTKNYTF